MYQIVYLGNVTCNKLGLFHRLSNRIFYGKNSFDFDREKAILVSQILLICKKADIKKFLIVGELSELENERFSNIIEILKQHNITCEVTGGLTYGEGTIQQVESYNDVVLIERIKKTHLSEVERDILFCKSQEINVMGYVTVL